MFLRSRMNTSSHPDFESLQQLLANAFAVQESQINTQSLADIMRVQRLVESGKLNLDGAMRQIVDSARKVANASGAAIALVSGDHLTYRAGSGTSAVCIGWSVAASLTVAAGAGPNREILRVENSQTDTRIEADICRQLGASSLLMLPIYLHGVVAGVLDIRFSEPHAFQDGEVRTYRLMAEQIETALCHPAQIEPAENRVVKPAESLEEVSSARVSFGALPDETLFPSADEEVIPPVDESLVLPPDFRMLPENEHSLYARCGALMADILDLPVFKQFVWLANQLTQPVRHIRWTPRRRSAPLTAAGEMPSVPRHTAEHTAEHTAVRTSIPRQRVKTITWPSRWRVSYLAAARELSNALASSLRGTVLRTTALTQRAKNLTWPRRWRNFPLVAAAELSSTFRRSILRATMLRQRAKSFTWPTRWRNLSLVAAAELSSTFRRSFLRASKFAQHAKTRVRIEQSLPIRWRRSSGAITAELSSFLKRSGLIMATLARRATNLVVLNPRRRLALETVAIVLAFAALVVYRGRVPAGSLESSTLSHSPAIEQQARPAEPLPEKSEFAAKPSPAAPINESRHTSNALKRVQVGKSEVDYVADDVTMRVFTPKPTAKRTRTPDGRIAQFGDDVTVRYFAPPPTPARTTTR